MKLRVKRREFLKAVLAICVAPTASLKCGSSVMVHFDIASPDDHTLDALRYILYTENASPSVLIVSRCMSISLHLLPMKGDLK